MKERFIGLGLTVGTVLTLGVSWARPVSAFSLNSKVTVENVLREPTTQVETPFQGPTPVTVMQGRELIRFGGIWDVDLGNNSIALIANSTPDFSNVESGDDVYRFMAADLSQSGLLPTVTIMSFTAFSSQNSPFARFISPDELEIVFPLGFAPEGLLPPKGVTNPIPISNVDLSVEPYAIPTPALLPGLVGMGLAILRKQRQNTKPD